MPLIPLIVLATLWHWAPPTTGATPDRYIVRQRDAWGDSVSTWVVADTTTTVTHEPLPYRLEVAACAGDTCGELSIPSAVYIPPRWRDLFYAMGQGLGYKGLSMTISAAARLSEAWPDSAGEKR